MARKLWPEALLFAAVLMSCLTVNVYFYPSEAVDKTAKQIVEDIRSQQDPSIEEEKTKTEKDKERSWLLRWSLTGIAEAADAETAVSNPAIEAIKGKIKAREGVLGPFYNSGAIGESKDGLLAIRDINVLPMQDRAKLNPVVKAENDDRMALYREVAKVLGVKDSDLIKVQRSFAKEWQRNTKAGWWIQEESGQWKQR